MTLSIHLWKTATDKEVIDLKGCVINPDDSINIILKKIAFYLDVPWTHLYCWVRRKIQTSQVSDIVNNFIRNAFQHTKEIKFDRLQKDFKSCFGTTLNSEYDRNVILDNEAWQLAYDNIQLRKTYVEPLGFQYSSSGYIQYVSFDPFTQKEQYENLILDNRLAHTLGYNPIYKKVINVVVQRDFPNLSHLFPFYKDNLKMENIFKDTTAKFIPALVETETYVESIDISDFTSSKYVSFLDVKAFPNINNSTSMEISRVFEVLHTSQQIPFIKLKLKTNAFYKIHKGFLPTVVDNKDLYRKLVTINTSSRLTLEYVTIRFDFGSGTGSLFLKDDGSYDLRLSFPIGFSVRKEMLVQCFQEVNNVFRKIINETSYQINLIPEDILNVTYNDVKVERIVFFGALSSPSVSIKSKAFANIIKSKFYPYFDVLDSKENDIINLQYKKVDNFSKFDNVEYFISLNYHLDKDELQQKLSSRFSLDKDEANQAISRWLSSNQIELVHNGNKTYFKPKHSTFVNIKLRVTSNLELKCMITGAKNFEMHDRIQSLLKALCKASSDAKLRSKKQDFLNDFNKELFLNVTDDSNKLTFNDLTEVDTEYETESDFDLDEEIQALNAEFANFTQEVVKDSTAKSTQSPIAPIVTDTMTKKGRSDLLSKLREADKDLFSYPTVKSSKRTDYASKCGAVNMRQPVVVTKDELDHINTTHQGAIHGFVQTGSTPALANKNYYVCPSIWCPKSRIAITYDTYKKAGYKCPNEQIQEEPILFIKEADKGNKENEERKLTKPTYPSFLEWHSHPKQFCLPCCFTRQPKEGNRNNQRLEVCKTNLKPETNVSAKPKTNAQGENEEDTVGNIKYIKGEFNFPIENGRYGLPSRDLGVILGNQSCGIRQDGTGLMKSKMSCCLRRGIDHGSQSFMSCLSYLFDVKGGASSVKQAIASNLTISEYIALESGKIMKLFIDDTSDIYDGTTFKQFKRWISDDKQRNYCIQFNLTRLIRELDDIDVFKDDFVKSTKEVVREFLIWGSYKRFLSFINDDTVVKDHRVLLDMVNHNFYWLNRKKLFVIVIEVDPVTNKSFVLCPSRNVGDISRVCLIMKKGSYYEPLVKVLNNTKVDLDLQLVFDASELKGLLSFVLRNCKIKNKKHEAETVQDYLQSKGLDTKFLVIDYSYKVCGLLLKNNLYIPLFDKLAIFDNGTSSNFVYYNSIPLFKCVLAETDIKTIYHDIETFTKDHRYKIKDYNESGFTINDGEVFVPLNLKKSNTLDSFQDDLNIFIGDEGKESFVVKSLERLVKADPQLRVKLAFLMDRGNPMPLETRKKELHKELKRLAFNVDLQSMESIMRKILLSILPPATGSSITRRFTANADEYVLSYKDVKSNKLITLYEIQKNPFQYINDTLDNLEAKSYEFFDDDNTLTSKKQLDAGTLAFDDVPTKYRKIMKEWNLAKPKEYTREWLLTLFSTISGKRITTETLASYVNIKVLQDFNENKDALKVLTTNPSFKELVKKLPKNRDKFVDTYIETMKNLNYYPSIYEVKLFGVFVKCNLIIDFRKGATTSPDGIELLLLEDKSAPYVLLKHDYNRFEKRDEISVFIKDQNQIVFDQFELPEEIQQRIKGKFEVEVEDIQ